MQRNEISAAAMAHFKSGLNCAESVLLTMCEYWELDAACAPAIATPFGGGFAGTQLSCGAMTGGLMAIGLRLGRDDEKGDRQPSYQAAKAFMNWFIKEMETTGCREITGIDMSNPEQNAAFRAPQGRHDTVCVPLVGRVTAYLAEHV